MKPDSIQIHGLELQTHIGVPAAERAAPQTVLCDLELTPPRPFEEMNDRIEATVDYDRLARRLRETAAAGPRHLIEQLAADLAAITLGEFDVLAVEIRIRKFILPETEHVAVRLYRQRG